MVSVEAQSRLQRPRLHICPAAHAWPHALQLCESVWKSTQAPLQAVCVPGHCTWHVPATHTMSEPQACPQAPQFMESLRPSTQRFEHVSCDGEHTAGTSMEPADASRPPTTLFPVEHDATSSASHIPQTNARSFIGTICLGLASAVNRLGNDFARPFTRPSARHTLRGTGHDPDGPDEEETP